MAVDWIPHRFVGGALALDVANTVVLRDDVVRRLDRFADPAELPRFAEAAGRFRRDELNGCRLQADATAYAGMIALRERVDRLFRAGATRGKMPGDDLASFLGECARAVSPAMELDFSGTATSEGGALPLQSMTAISALSLLPRAERIRICGNCGWLFLDRSRNGSRVWCDMSVCGNRQKAKRHYRRGKEKVDA